jgi:phosphoribosylamine--glycine ligase
LTITSLAVQYANNKGYENIVIKADGLAAGKGVFIPETKSDMETVLKDLLINKTLGKSGESLLIEDKIFGPEVSVFCFTDGVNYSDLIAICDYKRVFDNNLGPNTGGMGCYSPPEFWNKNLEEKIKKNIIEPTLLAMQNNGTPFKGILYTGIMITQNGPKVIEYNCRFGDPECELMMPMLNNNISDIFNEIANGNLTSQVSWKQKSSVCVVICSGGYPEKYITEYKISGIDKLSERVICFHSGTKELNKKLVSNGGRVLVLSCLDTSIKKARENIYTEIDKIKFSNSFYRKDIALRAME